MTLELTEAEYLELRVAALSRIDLLTRALTDPDFDDEAHKRHRYDLHSITAAADKIRAAFIAEVA